MKGSWMFGLVTLTVLVALHWLAYRVGEKRQKARRAAQTLTRDATTMSGGRVSDGPITPK